MDRAMSCEGERSYYRQGKRAPKEGNRFILVLLFGSIMQMRRGVFSGPSITDARVMMVSDGDGESLRT